MPILIVKILKTIFDFENINFDLENFENIHFANVIFSIFLAV